MKGRTSKVITGGVGGVTPRPAAASQPAGGEAGNRALLEVLAGTGGGPVRLIAESIAMRSMGMRPPSGFSNRALAGCMATAEAGMASPLGLMQRAIDTSGSGEGLPQAVRGKLEAVLGRSLDHVRVHQGRAAEAASKAVDARAVTMGTHIFFGSGAWSPDSEDGLHLLLHEVQHTLQEVDHRASATPGDPLSHPGDALEQEAEAGARRALAELRSGAPERPVREPARAPLAPRRSGAVHRFGGSVPHGAETAFELASAKTSFVGILEDLARVVDVVEQTIAGNPAASVRYVVLAARGRQVLTSVGDPAAFLAARDIFLVRAYADLASAIQAGLHDLALDLEEEAPVVFSVRSSTGDDPAFDTLFVNGIDNSMADAHKSAQQLADLCGDQVTTVWNASIGSSSGDLGESAAQKLGVDSTEANNVRAELERRIVPQGEAPARKVRLVAHSQGALVVAQALEQVAERLGKLAASAIAAHWSRPQAPPKGFHPGMGPAKPYADAVTMPFPFGAGGVSPISDAAGCERWARAYVNKNVFVVAFGGAASRWSGDWPTWFTSLRRVDSLEDVLVAIPFGHAHIDAATHPDEGVLLPTGGHALSEYLGGTNGVTSKQVLDEAGKSLTATE